MTRVMMRNSSKVRAIGFAGATLAAVLATACGGGNHETARAPEVRTDTRTAIQVGTTHTTAATPEPARKPRLTPVERTARRAEERAQLVVLKTQCESESGTPYAKTERAKLRETNEADAKVLEHACQSAALALASIVEKDEAAAADEKAAARAADEAAAKDAGLLP